jgi:hypothetical protein
MGLMASLNPAEDAATPSLRLEFTTTVLPVITEPNIPAMSVDFCVPEQRVGTGGRVASAGCETRERPTAFLLIATGYYCQRNKVLADFLGESFTLSGRTK